jgi:hypothetical protein
MNPLIYQGVHGVLATRQTMMGKSQIFILQKMPPRPVVAIAKS